MPSASVWAQIRGEAEAARKDESALSAVLAHRIVDHADMASSLRAVLCGRLGDCHIPVLALNDVLADVYERAAALADMAGKDLLAIRARDPAAESLLVPYLFFKGFHALQAHRVAHHLWNDGRATLAQLIQSAVSERCGVDIHPAARIGQGVMMDHATGIVIGETAVVGDDVSLLHAVTLGGTGHAHGDRHPKIASGVMIGAGAKVLGNIRVGTCARIAAGSVVLEDVPPRVTVAGVPARVVGKAGCEKPAEEMDQLLAEGCVSI